MTQIFSCAPFYSKYIKQLTPNDQPSLCLLGNPKLHFFARTLGAIDGSHINLAAPSFIHDACCNWKGFISQNCLFCCLFNLLFTYALTGRDQLLMQESMLMLFNQIWGYLMDGICLLMQDFHTVMNCWFLIVVSNIIYRNGERPMCGNVAFIIIYSTILNILYI